MATKKDDTSDVEAVLSEGGSLTFTTLDGTEWVVDRNPRATPLAIGYFLQREQFDTLMGLILGDFAKADAVMAAGVDEKVLEVISEQLTGSPGGSPASDG